MLRTTLRPLALVLLAAVAAPAALAAESDALEISATIQERHLPHGTVVDPIMTTPDGFVVDRYTRGGDAAIWTGHYLAAESLRYGVTKSPEALANAKRALGGIKGLVNAPGTGLLARVRVPVDWEETVDERAIITEEAGHGVYRVNKKKGAYYWIGNTSRDQYVGVFFGLATAYEQIDETADPTVRKTVGWIATRLLDFLLKTNWAVRMPDGRVSTVFTGRFDQQLMLLQVGRRVNPDAYTITYEKYRKKYASYVSVPIALEVQEPHDSYFKFNLAYATLYTLIRLEEPDSRYLDRYRAAYATLRAATAGHENAHFNAIDRALEGPDTARDFETRKLLREWLERPRRDTHVDLDGVYRACGVNEACEPIPVRMRVPTDFLWQRSPFQLTGGSDGRIEGAGIDYILPYWMSRAHDVAVD